MTKPQAPSPPAPAPVTPVTTVTTASIAASLGVTPRRVLAIAASRGVTPALRIGRALLWPPDAADRLRPRPTGRPPARRRPPPNL